MSYVLFFIREINMLLYDNIKPIYFKNGGIDMLMMSLEKFEQAEKELKDVLRHEAADGIESMDTNTLNAIQSVFKFMDASTELIKEQTRTIYEMDEKIDEILSKVSGNTAR